MSKEELKECLKCFYTSARKKDGTYYKNTSMKSIRAAIDRFLRSPPHSNTFFTLENFQNRLFTLHLIFDRLNNSSLVFATSWRQIVVYVAVTFIQLFTQAVSLGLVLGFLFSFLFFFFSAFSHKSPSGLYSACVTNACLRRLLRPITEVVVVKS